MIDLHDIRERCLVLPGFTEDFPFGEDVVTFRVGGKIFALASLEAVPQRINLKCDPELAIELRARYPAVIPGYHMNKKHWNTVTLDGTVPDSEVCAMVERSYALVRDSLPRTKRP
jgi:predicted DNA-binding protein (MmcQ/YjbR family)